MKGKCPACERFIGLQDECPYCGCDAVTPGLVRKLRLGAAVLAVVGLCCLVMMVVANDVPLVRAGRVTPMMNFARARFEGVVERNAYVSRKEGVADYLSFYIDDGTGSLRVMAYADVARELEEAGRLPEKDDEVEVCGSLRIMSGRKPALRLERAEIIWK
jgi:hypothetical protein